MDDQSLSSADPATSEAQSTASVPVTTSDATASEVRNYLLSSPRFESAAGVAVVEAGRLVGLVQIEDLLCAPGEALISGLMDHDPPTIAPHTTQEAAAWKAVDHGQGALAVTDEEGMFVGLIPPWRMLAILLREHDEDMARLGGYLHQGDVARSAMTEPMARRYWHRLPWLLVGLVAAMAAAGIVGGFEERLRTEVALAFFIPGIVYMADAVGTQTEAVIVRGLSVGVPARGVVGRELATGAAMGATLAVVAYPMALLWANNAVAATVAASIWAACTVATSVAMGLPWLLRSFGQDPAFGSGPLATVMQDLLSILIYFGFAVVFV